MTDISPQITARSVFLVSGGGRGITAQAVIRLARIHRCRFILLGRSPYQPSDPAWAAPHHDEAALKQALIIELRAAGQKPTPKQVQQQCRQLQAAREIRQTLAAVAAAGGQAHYCSVDVSDRTALETALAPAITKFGPVTGLIHGAGVLADKQIIRKTEADFEAVYRTKVTGLENLLACVPPQQLQHLVLFSSAAGFYGNAGQTDYALANEVLNKMAHRLKQEHPQCHIVSINWGPWDGGMVTPEVKALFDARQIKVIPEAAGTALLAEQLQPQHRHRTQIVVSDPFPLTTSPGGASGQRLRIRRSLREADTPPLQSHRIAGRTILPMTYAMNWLINAAEQGHPGFYFSEMHDLQVYKGITFDTGNKDYFLDLEAGENTTEHLKFQARLSTHNTAGLFQPHYAATLTLRQQTGARPRFTEASTLIGEEGEDANRYYRQRALFHGPDLAGIERLLHQNENQVTARCRLPIFSSRQQGQFPNRNFHPALNDLQLQLILIWVQIRYDVGGLPLGIAQVTQFQPLPEDTPFYVTMTELEHRPNHITVNLVSYDKDGQVYNRFDGVRATLSRHLRDQFRQESPSAQTRS